MPCPVTKLTDSIRQAYSNQLSRRHLYTMGFAATTIASGGSIALGILFLLVGLKGCSIPGINAINHLGTIGAPLTGGLTIAGGIGLGIGESYIIYSACKKPSRNTSENTVNPNEETSNGIEDIKKFTDELYEKGIGLRIRIDSFLPCPSKESHYYDYGVSIYIHLPKEGYLTEGDHDYKGYRFNNFQDGSYSHDAILEKLKNLGFQEEPIPESETLSESD